MFFDRKEAGQKLAKALEKYRNKKALVLAIPKGGIEVAYGAASFLNADFSVLIARKLPYPGNPEAGFGAIAEDGSMFVLEDAGHWLSKALVEQIMEEQKEEIERRIKVLRNGKPLPKIEGRTVILIDDGLAMGSTMRASLMLCRKRKAKKIIVAVPVAGKRVVEDMKKLADEVVVLETPEPFYAVADAYREWHDVSDEEAVGILEKAGKKRIS